jgi:signal peptidase I
LQQAVRLVTRGATRYSLTAPADGEVMFPVYSNGRPAVSARSGRNLLVFPTDLLEFTFAVGGQTATIAVPAEFDARGTWLKDTFFPGQPGDFYSALRDKAAHAEHLESSMTTLHNGDQHVEARVFWVPLGKQVRRGEKILSFDILTGDLLFVDRMSYNFVRPRVGSGFVFKTENIISPSMERADGTQIKEYYIKRLVGVPGDTLEVKAPVLWRNGRPIEGARAFGLNARQEGIYPGYTNGGSLEAGAGLKIPEKSFFAMGDNSPDSKDSRYWGFVPEREVVGRPLFIYYPLTSRWGPAR